MSLPTTRTGGTIAAVCSKSPHIPRSHRIENIPRLHPDPDRPAGGLHVRARASATPIRRRRSAASSSNCRTDRATAHRGTNGGNAAAPDCPNGYTRTHGYGDPRDATDHRAGTNRHANAADGDCGSHGNACRRAAHTDAVAHLTASQTDGYGNDHHAHNGVARHGIGHPFEPP